LSACLFLVSAVILCGTQPHKHMVGCRAGKQITALEMKKLLVAGKQKDALMCAQQGQLWGPALLLACQLGDKVSVLLLYEFYPQWH
jgi:hypothetical protein